MQKYLLSTYFIIGVNCLIFCQSQIGGFLGYRFMDYPNWSGKPLLSSNVGEVAAFKNNIAIGLEYTKQLNKTSLNSWVVTASIDKSLTNTTYANMGNFALQGGYRFFPFNQEDCDCPSFYQTGSTFSRGFNITPHVGANALWISGQSIQIQMVGGVDVGLDIPLNKAYTISPFVGINVTSYARHEGLGTPELSSNTNSLTVGIKGFVFRGKRR
jgi:hypothetical protein